MEDFQESKRLDSQSRDSNTVNVAASGYNNPGTRQDNHSIRTTYANIETITYRSYSSDTDANRSDMS